MFWKNGSILYCNVKNICYLVNAMGNFLIKVFFHSLSYEFLFPSEIVLSTYQLHNVIYLKNSIDQYNFLHSVRYIQVYDKDKNEKKFQYFIKFRNKINDNEKMCLYFHFFYLLCSSFSIRGFTFQNKTLQYLSCNFQYVQTC